MERIFEVVRLGDLIEKDVTKPDGQTYRFEKRQVILKSGADSLVADIIGPTARNFTYEPGEVVDVMLRLNADCYNTRDGEERISTTARIIDFVKLPKK